jgi:hypothetical protein
MSGVTHCQGAMLSKTLLTYYGALVAIMLGLLYLIGDEYLKFLKGG